MVYGKVLKKNTEDRWYKSGCINLDKIEGYKDRGKIGELRWKFFASKTNSDDL